MCYRVSDMIAFTLFPMHDIYLGGGGEGGIKEKKKPDKVTFPMPLILPWEVSSAANTYIYPNDSQLSCLQTDIYSH